MIIALVAGIALPHVLMEPEYSILASIIPKTPRRLCPMNHVLPQCVTTCIGGANYFGDLNEPDHLINKMINRGNVTILKEEEGTNPKVFYLR